MNKSTPSRKILKQHNLLQGTDSQCEQQKPRKIISSPPNLILPFPPHIVPEDLINSQTCKLPSKPPNAFFIYRKVYTKELIAQNLRFKMTDVSSWVSNSWKLEPEEVKTKYKEIAREVRKIYKQIKLDIEDKSKSSSANTSPDTTQPSTPLPASSFNKDDLNSNPGIFIYDESNTNNTGLQNPIVGGDLDYCNNDPSPNLSDFNWFNSSSNQSTLWQYNLPQTIFENISAELSYSEYMVSPNNTNNAVRYQTPQFEMEPWAFEDLESFDNDIDLFELAHHHYQY